ncbi:hypothetical protein TELCIR_16621, partial [Teladorsagia circumcincta]
FFQVPLEVDALLKQCTPCENGRYVVDKSTPEQVLLHMSDVEARSISSLLVMRPMRGQIRPSLSVDQSVFGWGLWLFPLRTSLEDGMHFEIRYEEPSNQMRFKRVIVTSAEDEVTGVWIVDFVHDVDQ